MNSRDAAIAADCGRGFDGGRGAGNGLCNIASMQNKNPPHLDSDSLYTAVFEELVGKDWSITAPVSIDELGIAVGTHLGFKRSRNEDRFAVARVRAYNEEVYTLALVCDGVGGSHSGDMAATIAVSSILHELGSLRTRPTLESLAISLVKGADDNVRATLKGKGTTTLVMVLGTGSGQGLCASVGDSRVYGWDRSAAKLSQITTDDTVENELRLIPGDHKALLQARGLQDRLSQALGESDRSSDELRVQIWGKDRFPDAVVLGSDGLWRASKDFEAVAANAKTAIDVVRRTINVANWVGGVDNSTLIAIQDLNLFFGSPAAFNPATSRASLTMWLGSTKVKLQEYLNSSVRTGAAPSPREDKPKRKARTKEQKKAPAEPQLKFEGDISQESRPVIEVTFDKTVDQSKK